MFGKLFSKRPAAQKDAAPESDPMQIAIAALMVEAARADERYEDREKRIIDRSLASGFQLPEEDVRKLRAQAEDVQSNANDIQQFTKVAKEMSQEAKAGFVEQLWEIVLSDGDKDVFEDSLIRRICGLIYVEDRQSGEARARAAARLTEKQGQ